MTLRNSRHFGAIACGLFALVSLAIAIDHARDLMLLLKHGVRAEAVVVGFNIKMTGGLRDRASGGIQPVLQFVTQTGENTVQQDLFQMILFRFQEGQRVLVVYDPSDPGRVTIDLGIWVWQQPGVLMIGFLLFAVLAMLLAKWNRS